MATSYRTPYARTAQALFERMKLVFSDKGLALHEEPPKKPEVSLGIPRTIPPFCVWVDILPHGATNDGGATTSENQYTFALNVYCVAKHSDRNKAVDALQKYVDSVCMGISAGATLNRSVDSATPSLGEAGVDATPENQYIAAASVEVVCKVAAVCPREFKELVK